MPTPLNPEDLPSFRRKIRMRLAMLGLEAKWLYARMAQADGTTPQNQQMRVSRWMRDPTKVTDERRTALEMCLMVPVGFLSDSIPIAAIALLDIPDEFAGPDVGRPDDPKHLGHLFDRLTSIAVVLTEARTLLPDSAMFVGHVTIEDAAENGDDATKLVAVQQLKDRRKARAQLLSTQIGRELRTDALNVIVKGTDRFRIRHSGKPRRASARKIPWSPLEVVIDANGVRVRELGKYLRVQFNLQLIRRWGRLIENWLTRDTSEIRKDDLISDTSIRADMVVPTSVRRDGIDYGGKFDWRANSRDTYSTAFARLWLQEHPVRTGVECLSARAAHGDKLLTEKDISRLVLKWVGWCTDGKSLTGVRVSPGHVLAALALEDVKWRRPKKSANVLLPLPVSYSDYEEFLTVTPF